MIFEGNQKNYIAYGADEVLANVCKAIPTVNWMFELESQITYLQKSDYP